MAKRPAKKTERAPTITKDPIAFWRAQFTRTKQDVELAREGLNSTLPKLITLQREAWREWKSAVAAAESGSGDDASQPAGTTLEARLAIAQRMRKSAEAAGSFVAATKLLEAEGAIAEEMRKRDVEAAKAARRGMDASEFLTALIAKVAAMPPAMQDEIRKGLGW